MKIPFWLYVVLRSMRGILVYVTFPLWIIPAAIAMLLFQYGESLFDWYDRVKRDYKAEVERKKCGHDSH